MGVRTADAEKLSGMFPDDFFANLAKPSEAGGEEFAQWFSQQVQKIDKKNEHRAKRQKHMGQRAGRHGVDDADN